jgi:hypothetical protein
MTLKTDLLTGEKFTPKRVTQQFANPRNRIKFYNNKAKEIREMKAVIDRPLHTNFYILNRLLGDKMEAVVHPEFLRGQGYDFEFHTHTDQAEGKLRYAVYRFVIIRVSDTEIKIIQRPKHGNK